MKVRGKSYRTISLDSRNNFVNIINQNRLPHYFEMKKLRSLQEICDAISDMNVRGAPLIGATAASGIWLAMCEDQSDESLINAYNALKSTRPTAVNLAVSLDYMQNILFSVNTSDRKNKAFMEANNIIELDVLNCSLIGLHGLNVLQKIHNKKPKEKLNVLTHCNAGWLACVDWGTALAPIYKAHDSGIPIHVWVDETRPRNQGASLTSWELEQHGVSHTLITDNAGGHIMQKGLVDICIVGSDRTTRYGDVCNKIGTYLKALAAYDNNIPFYVALPTSTIDTLSETNSDFSIEERDPKEVLYVTGKDTSGKINTISIAPDGTNAVNYAFDVTPSKFIKGLITEKGVCKSNTEDINKLLKNKI